MLFKKFLRKVTIYIVNLVTKFRTMPSIYNQEDNEKIIARIQKLLPDSQPLWGKMTVSQMLSHCQAPIDFAFGKTPIKVNFFMQLLGKMFKNKILKSNEFKKNSPTAKEFLRTETYNFNEVQQGLIDRIVVFSEQGHQAIKNTKHPFFGKMTYEEWSQLHVMHLDHHLKQFGV